MLLFNRLKVGSKLLLLAGVPVLGILALSALVVLDVRSGTALVLIWPNGSGKSTL